MVYQQRLMQQIFALNAASSQLSCDLSPVHVFNFTLNLSRNVKWLLIHIPTGSRAWEWIMYNVLANQHPTYLSSLSAAFASICKVQDKYDSLRGQGEREHLVVAWSDAITPPNE